MGPRLGEKAAWEVLRTQEALVREQVAPLAMPKARATTWRRTWSALLALGGVAASLTSPAPAAAAPAKDLTALVNPFVGAGPNGFTFPGADVPFGMVQLSPDTVLVNTSIPFQSAAGLGYSYLYSDTTVAGFSLTHLSGAGCTLFGDAPMMPTVGPVTTTDPTLYRSAFTHARESASPGQYSVDLISSGTHVDLTATTRTAWLRAVFPPASQANLLLNVGSNLDPNGPLDAAISVEGDRAVDEMVRGGGFCGSAERYTVYAHVEFSRPFATAGTWKGSSISPGSRTASGPTSGGYVTFDASTDPVVVARVGLSFTSADGARANLAAETLGWDFDAVARSAQTSWNTQLSRIDVTGGSAAQRSTFYTALYHSLLFPSTFSDADGSYRGFDGAVHRASGWTQVANLSLWDTYRSQTQLLELAYPERAHDLARSLIADAAEGGWMPKWPVANGDSNTQQGDSAAPTLVDLYLKGFLSPAEAATAYAALLRNATATPPASSAFAGRPYLDSYTRIGWVPFVSPLTTGFPAGPSGGAGYATLFAASATQEYALDDCDLAQMAAGLGDDGNRRMLAARSTHWRRLFDAATGYVRPRAADGTYFSPFDPYMANVGFEEASATQYLWFEPEDVSGLIARLGGADAATARLDQLFDYSRLVAAPLAVATAQEAQGTVGLVIHDAGMYSPDNEPDIQVPYLYLYTGRPWKTQAVVNAEEMTYNDTPAGLPGNDDLGTISAWYVLSAMGVYPMTYGVPVWGLTTPLFDTVVVQLQAPWYQQPAFTITAPGASAGNIYIQSASLNGAPLDRDWLDHRSLDGGDLRLVVGSQPQPAWAATSTPPSPCSGPTGLGSSGQAPFHAPPTASTGGNQTVTPATTPRPGAAAGIAVVTVLLGAWTGGRRRRRPRVTTTGPGCPGDRLRG